MLIEEVDFETILPIWRDKLWPGRKRPIEPISTLVFGRDVHDSDDSIKDAIESGHWPKPVFLAGYINNEIIAVNSGHVAAPHLYRSRGLYVEPEHRGKGHGKSILEATSIEAKKAGCNFVWAMPRQGSEYVYESLGWTQVGDWFEEEEFGPHCFMFRVLGKGFP